MRCVVLYFLLYAVVREVSTETTPFLSTEGSTEVSTERPTESTDELTTDRTTERTTVRAIEHTTERLTERTTERLTERTTERSTERTTERTTERNTGRTTETFTTSQTTDSPTDDSGLVQRNIETKSDICSTTNPCQGEHIRCIVEHGESMCICDDGFEFEDNQRNACIDINECLMLPCREDRHEICMNMFGSFTCGCQAGYQQDDMQECEDIDECLSESCGDNQYCVNLNGSYVCSCSRGYQKSFNDSCIDTDECEEGVDDCQLFVNTNCYTTEGTFRCLCKEGYLEDSSGVCTVTDICNSNFASTCQYPEGSCMTDENGTNNCICSPGFMRNTKSKVCINKNECINSSSLCDKTANSHCVDIVPTAATPDDYYLCECNEGFTEVDIGTCLEAQIFRIFLLVTAVNGNEEFSLWSSDLKDYDSKKFTQLSELLCSFFEGHIAGKSNIISTSCSGLAFEVTDNGIKAALKMSLVSVNLPFKADVLENYIVEATTRKYNGTLMWRKSNNDYIVVMGSSFNVEVVKNINCQLLDCLNGGTCTFDEQFYEISCRCRDGVDGEHCENDRRDYNTEETIHTDNESSLTTVNQNYALSIGVSVVAVFILALLIGLVWSLLRSKYKGNNKDCVTCKTPAKCDKERPLISKVPYVVNNPFARRRPVQRLPNEDKSNYDEVRLRSLEKTFSMMVYPTPISEEMNIADYEKETEIKDYGNTASAEFALPYQTDGSINV